MKDAILAVVAAKGQVVFPIKWKYSEWFSESSVGWLGHRRGREKNYFVRHNGDYDYYMTAEEAAEVFVNLIFTQKNLALCYEGIKAHGMSDEDFDDLSQAKIKQLVEKYRKEHWDADYPFAAGK